ncbi:uncharacterized protein cenpt [Genypterus blacodes]|uniref:uncharacterized protein cenpt n=1 Tax=Genypterus blacodes TaxID=154954 RepID=UPI003F7590B9
MDNTEDLSARVLFKQILDTEEPRTPLTHSESQRGGASEPRRSSSRLNRLDADLPGTSGIRRSSRLNRPDAGAQTPQDLLKRSLKQKIRESLTRKSLPPKRRTASAVRRRTNTADPTSLLYGDDDTPRHLLKNILREESVKSPLVHKEPVTKELQLPSANSSLNTRRPSVDLSELELPDVTLTNAVSSAKGLSRKRRRQSLNVTAFEKRLKERDDVEKEGEESEPDHSLSSTFSSSATLSLKTPFVDVGTEKRGLQRKVPHRHRISTDEFGAALYRRQIEAGVSGIKVAEQLDNETSDSGGFSLNLSVLTEPNITADIVGCDPTLCTQPEAPTSHSSTVAAQDKPTLQEDTPGVEEEDEVEEEDQVEEEEQMEVEQTQNVDAVESEPETTEGCTSVKPQSEVVDAAESQNEEENKLTSLSEEAAAVTSQSEEEEGGDEAQTEGRNVASTSREVANEVESQTGDEGAAHSETEGNAAGISQEEEEEETAAAFAAESQTEEDPNGPQVEEDIAAQADFEGEECTAESQPEEEETADSQTEEEEPAAESQTEEAADYQNTQEDPSDDHQSEGEAGVNDSNTEHDGKQEDEDEAEQESEQPDFEVPDLAEPSTQEEPQNVSGGAELRPEADEGDSSPDENADEEEEWENEDDDIRSQELKTPAFVRQKRIFPRPEPTASTSNQKIQPRRVNGASSSSKPKPVRGKKTQRAKRESVLPKSYLMNAFKHFAKTKVSADVYPVLQETMEKFFTRMAEDLETFALHAKRKTIEVEDVELLLKRQGHVNDKVPVEVLIEKYLRMDQRRLLIPIATSGNVVIPKLRR